MLTPAKVTTVGTNNIAVRSFFRMPFTPCIPRDSFDTSNGTACHFHCKGRGVGVVHDVSLLIVSRVDVIHTSLLSSISTILEQFHSQGGPFNNIRLLVVNSLRRLSPMIGSSR